MVVLDMKRQEAEDNQKSGNEEDIKRTVRAIN
jgi:hypothetical protein